MPSGQNLCVKIALTGTPGTGKTTIADELKDRFEVIHLSDFLEEKDIGEKVEREREVRIGEMVEKLEEESFPEDVLIEGHLAHHFPADTCVVLRCRPDILEERLSGREYTPRKVEENVEAEKIDIILTEAVQKQDKIIEIDTTEKTPEETAEEVLEKIERGENKYGSIDWTEFL
jgi:adenylate kinase